MNGFVYIEWLDWQRLINGRMIVWYLEDDFIKCATF